MAQNNVQTKRMGNFDMASAADRVKAFWENNPSGKISTVKSKEEDGMLVFKTYIWKKKSDYLKLATIPGIDKDVLLSSADVEGSAKQGNTKMEKKDFEKLETISVGRALALMGFSKDGSIASTEEMEEFAKYKDDREEEAVLSAVEYIEESNDLPQLQERFIGLENDLKKDDRIFATKEAMKKKLQEKAEKEETEKQIEKLAAEKSKK
jgi:hypothetical protein